MRTIIDRLGWGIGGAATIALVAVLAGLVSAGPLDPTGSPGSTSGVRLPGTAIESLPHTITTPGHYYLRSNLTGVSGQPGIVINTNDVTLDLNGFVLQGVPGSGSGVLVNPPTFRRGIVVRNGIVRGWGDTGIQAQFANGGVFDSLTAEGNTGWGIIAGVGGTLTHCNATGNTTHGVTAFNSVITECTARSNGASGFQVGATVLTDCVATENGSNGIEAGASSNVSRCTVYQNQAVGILAAEGTITDNEVYQNFGDGIEVTGNGALVARNNVNHNSISGVGAGIDVSGSVSRIDENHVSDLVGFPTQDAGIRVTGSRNVVIRNSSHGNVSANNYELTGLDGSYGPLANAASTTSAWTNINY